MRVLLAEDDDELARRLSATLTDAGFAVDRAGDGEYAAQLGFSEPYDAVVLDLGLPKVSGLEVLRRWRRQGLNTPVLVLTARDAWTDRVEGLNAGADDYLGKPFQGAEVVARLRALMRRASGAVAPQLVLGPLSVDVAAGAAWLDGSPVELTARELRILEYLMHRQGRIVSQSELMDHVYPIHEARESNTIEVYIGRLRRKIGRDLIRTVRGLGYRMG